MPVKPAIYVLRDQGNALLQERKKNCGLKCDLSPGPCGIDTRFRGPGDLKISQIHKKDLFSLRPLRHLLSFF